MRGIAGSPLSPIHGKHPTDDWDITDVLYSSLLLLVSEERGVEEPHAGGKNNPKN